MRPGRWAGSAGRDGRPNGRLAVGVPHVEFTSRNEHHVRLIFDTKNFDRPARTVHPRLRDGKGSAEIVRSDNHNQDGLFGLVGAAVGGVVAVICGGTYGVSRVLKNQYESAQRDLKLGTGSVNDKRIIGMRSGFRALGYATAISSCSVLAVVVGVAIYLDAWTVVLGSVLSV